MAHWGSAMWQRELSLPPFSSSTPSPLADSSFSSSLHGRALAVVSSLLHRHLSLTLTPSQSLSYLPFLSLKVALSLSSCKTRPSGDPRRQQLKRLHMLEKEVQTAPTGQGPAPRKQIRSGGGACNAGGQALTRGVACHLRPPPPPVQDPNTLTSTSSSKWYPSFLMKVPESL